MLYYSSRVCFIQSGIFETKIKFQVFRTTFRVGSEVTHAEVMWLTGVGSCEWWWQLVSCKALMKEVNIDICGMFARKAQWLFPVPLNRTIFIGSDQTLWDYRPDWDLRVRINLLTRPYHILSITWQQMIVMVERRCRGVPKWS